MESSLEAFHEAGPERLVYVEAEELKLVMLTDSELFLLDVYFANWIAPPPGEGLVELEDTDETPEVAASGREAAAEAQQPAGGDGAEVGPSADGIIKARAAMRQKY